MIEILLQCNVRSFPYYKQLGFSSTLEGIRNILEKRIGLCGRAIRIESVIYAAKEAKSKEGCPIAKSILRRSDDQEIVLALVRHRKGHKCGSAYIVVAIVVWDAIDRYFADKLYDIIVYKVNEFGISTERRCARNEAKTCGCQGLDERKSGACYSFGCSWSMFRDGCKFRDSQQKNIRKFRLKNRNQEYGLEYHLQQLATGVAPLYEAIAPDAFYNQIAFESEGSDCRIGMGMGRPFSGVTACLDFCAHSHKDLHNINNGCTVVVTLTKCRDWRLRPNDEQLHVLPMYSIACFDEFGSFGQQLNKISLGAIQVLNKFPAIKRVFPKRCETNVKNMKLNRNHKHFNEVFDKNLKKIVQKNKCNEEESEAEEYYSDNDYCFEDQSMGGLAIALSHRSVLFECAKHEIHATTGLQRPNRQSPSRISLVLYQHRALNYPKHGMVRDKCIRKPKKCVKS